MKKYLSVILGIAIALTFSGCSSEGKEKVELPKETHIEREEKSKVNIDFGTYEDQKYVNEYLKLKFQIPDNWTYMTENELRELMAIDGELEDEESAMILYAIENQTNETRITSGISLTLEKEELYEDLDTYLFEIKAMLESSEVSFEEIKRGTTKIINEQEFEVLEVKLKIDEGLILNQDYYAMKKEDYILTFITTYIEEEKANIRDIIENIEFKEDLTK